MTPCSSSTDPTDALRSAATAAAVAADALRDADEAVAAAKAWYEAMGPYAGVYRVATPVVGAPGGGPCPLGRGRGGVGLYSFLL